MRTSHDTWDVTLYFQRDGLVRIGIPKPLGRGLREKGYTRAKLQITDAGILLVPYAGDRVITNSQDTVALPDWNGA